MTRTLAVCVQTVKGREAALGDCCRSLEESDVGTDYSVLVHPPGILLGDHCMNVLRHLAATDADIVLRLEDDVIVNRHMKHNLVTWAAYDDPRFGAGWLFPIRGIWDYRYGPPKVDTWEPRDYAAASLAVVFKRTDLVEWLPEIQSWTRQEPQDFAMSCAVVRGAGRMLCYHAPGLVENNVKHPSFMNHGSQPVLGQNWYPDWKRTIG